MIYFLTVFFILFTQDSFALERTVQDANPGQLETEIRSIPNFPQKGIGVYLMGQNDAWVYIDESEISLTQQQISDLDSTISNHVPNRTRRQISDEIDTLTKRLRRDEQDWDSLTQADKLSVMKRLLRREVLRDNPRR